MSDHLSQHSPTNAPGPAHATAAAPACSSVAAKKPTRSSRPLSNKILNTYRIFHSPVSCFVSALRTRQWVRATTFHSPLLLQVSIAPRKILSPLTWVQPIKIWQPPDFANRRHCSSVPENHTVAESPKWPGASTTIAAVCSFVIFLFPV